MSDFTVNDTMAAIIYEEDEREIYNDIRSETGILIAETVVDADPTYSWKKWRRAFYHTPGITYARMFTASLPDPLDWQLVDVKAADLDHQSYYDYRVWIVSTNDDRTKAVFSKNTGSKVAGIGYTLKYKYLTANAITHTIEVPATLTVRATDATSIRRYGRRVMNLTWSEGTEEGAMQALVDHYLTRFKDPVHRLKIKLIGTTDTLRTQIITREISDLITVVSDNLGINADYFINAITIGTGSMGNPVCTWEVEARRAEEALTLFLIGTSALDGPHVLGS